ncbi:MAG: endopeptidase La [Deltaproteobacteria bacterium]|nr:endopeptidase La [Deltaproteobacteria bacterium]
MAFFKRDQKTEQVIEVEELVELRLKIKNMQMSAQVEKAALTEIDKLEKSSHSSAEYTIGINYLDYLTALPWNKATVDNLDIQRAEKILDEEHYGLDEIKERILEHLAVRIMKVSRKFEVLVVDDEKRVRENLQYVLAKEGYDTITAKNGREALDILKDRKVDIIITDLKMDEVDGMELLGKARAGDPEVKVIMITGYATVPSYKEAMEKGSFNYIAKPFELDEIRSTVSKALAPKTFGLVSKGSIICFAGPPGTGKTSLGMGIAASLGKKFIRISLAGMKDEAEIRGHRRSYVGAMPGRIIQEIRRAESNNPVFMLDELDKIGQDFKGDPASALLEVLDPQQNSKFIDHYLDVPFDLSRVMFIATANTVDLIPGPLLDRLEVLHLSGYTEDEKEQIASNHLIPKAINAAGLNKNQPEFTADAIQMIISEYTREAGLRNLQRQLDSICRKLAREILKENGKDNLIKITPESVRRYLGPRKFFFEVAEAQDRIGTVTGLAWTESGGEIIFIEATMMKGKSKLILTGSLGDVMKESAQAALSYIRSNTQSLNIPEDFFDNHDIHIHVPAGAIPKDGPSAGLTIAAALISLLTGRPAKRDVALTGELTLSGRILPVGGIKEKIMAARRAGVKTVIFPEKNDSDLKNISDEIKKDLNIIKTSQFDTIVDKILK